MTWENPWGSPLASQNLDQLSNQYQTQLDALNRIKAAGSGVLEEINKELSSLSKEEQKLLLENQDYLMAKNLYETGLLNFISSKFSCEYVSTQGGKEAANNLLKVIKGSKEKIMYQAKIRDEKINKVLDMLENDPELRKRYEEYGK
jgi:hypothetical protein